MATGDIDRAARYLLAFVRGDDGQEAEAGAYLFADTMVSIRAIEGVKVEWKDGPRPGI